MQPSDRSSDHGPEVGFALDRFVGAQESNGTYGHAIEELRAGQKRSHWMWFVFPQIAGLGHSDMARRFAISSLDEAEAYFRHPVLGPRLVECARAVLRSGPAARRSAEDMLGAIDAVKLRSSMTLFHLAAPECPEFGQVLDRYFDGQPDLATIECLGLAGGR